MHQDDRPAGDAAQRIARDCYGRLVAFLAARTRDVASAEDALSDAFVAALDRWPRQGVPDNPEAWLLTVARRRLADAARRGGVLTAAAGHLQLLQDEIEAGMAEDRPVPDDRLALMFACAHPAIEARMRAPLMLQAILGFDAATIATAFLIPPATMGQRLVRAKAKLKNAGVPFGLPDRADLPARLDAVLEAIYAAFSEGWSNPAGTDIRRRELAAEAIWLGRLVSALLPDEPEALGLLSLMLHLEARRTTRRDAAGEYVALTDQDPAGWNAALIDEAEAFLHRAGRMRRPGRYQLEAAIQSAHAVRRAGQQPDWTALTLLYDRLAALTGSPVVAINYAVALASLNGPEAGLAALDRIGSDPRLADYQPYWAARAELSSRAGDRDNAEAAYARAIALETDPSVRRFLERRRTGLAPKP